MVDALGGGDDEVVTGVGMDEAVVLGGTGSSLNGGSGGLWVKCQSCIVVVIIRYLRIFALIKQCVVTCNRKGT